MSSDIGPILAKCSHGNERNLLSQLLPSASKASLQTYINSLSSKCDQYQRVECLRTVLQHSSELCQDNGDKLLPILNRIIQRPGLCGQLANSVYKCLSLIIQSSINSSDTGKKHNCSNTIYYQHNIDSQTRRWSRFQCAFTFISSHVKIFGCLWSAEAKDSRLFNFALELQSQQ